MTEQFDSTEFSVTLPKKKNKVSGELIPMFDYVGIDRNEHCWAMPLGEGKLRILARSSINASTGLADGTGENSIRLIVQRKHKDSWVSISKGPDAYTTRIPGWKGRLRDKIKHLYDLWNVVKQDFSDDEKIFISKQPNTKGRVFAKNSVTQGFRWLS